MCDCYETIQRIAERELIPALGCTEPMAFGLVCSAARYYAGGQQIQRIHVEGSPSMIKGVAYVKIPRSGGLNGGKYAAAIGAFGGNHLLDMEVFAEVTPEDVKKAVAFADSGAVQVDKVDADRKLYLKAEVITEAGRAVALIQDSHNNICYIEQNGTAVKDTRLTAQQASEVQEEMPDYSILSVKTIFDFCKNAPLSHFGRIEETIRLSKQIAQDGMDNPYGLQVGRNLRDAAGGRLTTLDLAEVATMWGAAGVDARMGGSSFPAMSNSGSGNQGITCTMPVVAVAEYLGKSYEEMVRAVALSNLLTVFVKTHFDLNYGRMAPVCCAAVAAGGSGTGVAYLLGMGEAEMSMILQNVLGSVAGLFCDGAKSNCALKVAMALQCAMQSVILASKGFAAGELDGVVGRTVEETICNFFTIQKEGMQTIEDVLCRIEADKENAAK